MKISKLYHKKLRCIFATFLMLVGFGIANAQSLYASRHHRESAEKNLVVSYIVNKYRLSVGYVQDIVDSAYRHATNKGLPPTLVVAAIEKESSFDAKVVNGYGAVGLMQVVPRYNRPVIQAKTGIIGEYSQIQALKNPDANIDVGTSIMKGYIKEAGSLHGGLQKYSGSARNYVTKINGFKQQIEKYVSDRLPDLEDDIDNRSGYKSTSKIGFSHDNQTALNGIDDLKALLFLGTHYNTSLVVD